MVMISFYILIIKNKNVGKKFINRRTKFKLCEANSKYLTRYASKNCQAWS